MEVWNINHDIEYAVVPGGHTDAVISLYAVKGGTVRLLYRSTGCQNCMLLLLLPFPALPTQ